MTKSGHFPCQKECCSKKKKNQEACQKVYITIMSTCKNFCEETREALYGDKTWIFSQPEALDRFVKIHRSSPDCLSSLRRIRLQICSESYTSWRGPIQLFASMATGIRDVCIEFSDDGLCGDRKFRRQPLDKLLEDKGEMLRPLVGRSLRQVEVHLHADGAGRTEAEMRAWCRKMEQQLRSIANSSDAMAPSESQ